MEDYHNEMAESYYLNPVEIEKTGGIWVLRMGRNVAKPNYQVGPRSIECYSLHFILEGNLFIQHEGRREELKKGDVFCMYPGRSYQYGLIRKTDSLSMVWIAFQGPQVEALLKAVGLSAYKNVKRGIVSKKLEQTLDILISHQRKNSDHSMSAVLAMQVWLYKIFQHLLDRFDRNNPLDEVAWLPRCIEFIHLHYTEGINIQDISDYVGVHRSYFSSVFTKQMGITPVKYVQKLRMEKATSLLESRERSVTEIAYSVGYPNLYSFSRAFRNYYGIHPSMHRQHI